MPTHRPVSWEQHNHDPGLHGKTATTALERRRTVLGPSLLTVLAHLEPVHQLQGLAVVLVGFEDDIGQLVDDDVQGALFLNRPAKVQLPGRGGGGDTERKNNFST